MARRDYTDDHTLYCTERNVASMRKMLPSDDCPTCQAYWAGYVAGAGIRSTQLAQGEETL